jgi:serine/threonine protein kinase
VVKARGPLPLTNACAYAYQAAQGLQHAFEKSMVHRDIKPHNLILARHGKKHLVKILDFGLAKATREGGTAHGLTGSGVMLGTPGYMAPEQISAAARAGTRADLYSLGCTLNFLLSGRPPFQAESLYALLHAQHTKEAVPLNRARADVPAGLAAVVAKLMAKDPARRYRRPAEAARALAPFLRGGLQPLAAPPPPAEAGSLASTAAPRTLKPAAATPVSSRAAATAEWPTRPQSPAPTSTKGAQWNGEAHSGRDRT